MDETICDRISPLTHEIVWRKQGETLQPPDLLLYMDGVAVPIAKDYAGGR